MQITNKYGLPQTIVNVVSGKNYPPKDNRFSASDLCNPPQQRKLKQQHWDKLEQDASGMLWMILGNAVHYVMEKGSPDNALSEEKLIVDFNGVQIVGIADLLHDHEISDYKITSVYSFLLGDKPEWTKQLNIYKWLYGKKGFRVDKLTINAILRDWKKSEALKSADYPAIPFISVDIPIQDDIEDVIAKAVIDLQAETPRLCTKEEKWQRDTTYALMKKGQKKAVKLFDSKKEAYERLSLASDIDNWEVAERPGSRTRCENYCIVKDFCQQYKKESEG